MGRFSRLGNDLYSGRRPSTSSAAAGSGTPSPAVIVVVAAIGLQAKPLDFGIEFVGGAQFKVTLPADQVTQDNADRLRVTVAATGIDAAASPVVTTSGESAIVVQTRPLTSEESAAARRRHPDRLGVDPQQDIYQSEVGAELG